MFTYLFRIVFVLSIFLIPPAIYAEPNPVIGMIDNVYSQPSTYPRHHVSGWACAAGLPQSIVVHLYSVDPAGTWHWVTDANANLPSEQAVADRCGSTGAAYRFDIAVDDQLAEIFGQNIYIYGISPNGGANALIDNSGLVTFPNAIKIASVLGHPLQIETGPAFGGAISSLKWNGHEFVNQNDHGREFQIAAQYNGWGECFNPTEAGSYNDGGPENMSTSHVVTYSFYPPDEILTTSYPAFYLKYDQTNNHCDPTYAYGYPNGGSTEPVSPFYTTKIVKVGYLDWENVIKVDTSISIPYGVHEARIESFVGSMDEQTQFQTLTPYNNYTTAIPMGDSRVNPGAQTWVNLPVILASNGDVNDTNNYALGIYNPHLIAENNPSTWQNCPVDCLPVGHFGWGIGAYNVVSWGSVFNFLQETSGPTSHSFTNYLVIGNLQQVVNTMKELHDTPDLP